MEEEIWKDIPEYEGMYQCSNFGRVKRIERYYTKNGKTHIIKEKILKSGNDGKGYPSVSLNLKNINVHKLVAICFLNHKPNGMKLVVDHIDGCKTNNNVKNLRIVTQRFNTTYGYRVNKNKYTSNYVGVSWYKKRNRWVSQITINGKSKYLGLYKTEIEAYNAYKSKLLEINE